jgi:hypothetical protein
MRVDGRTTFVLPGRWWTLKTEGSESQMVAAIKAEVERTVGREDSRASLRRALRTQLLDAAHEARRLGADRLYLAEEITDGVPFPASLTVIKADVPPCVEEGTAERVAALAGLLPSTVVPEVCDFVDHAMVRTVVVSESSGTGQDAGQDPESGSDRQEVPILKVDYLLAAPVTGEVIVFAFGTPLVPMQDNVIELFDAILGTVSFPETSPVETSVP